MSCNYKIISHIYDFIYHNKTFYFTISYLLDFWLYISKYDFIPHKCKVTYHMCGFVSDNYKIVFHIYDFISHNMTLYFTITMLFVVILALYFTIWLYISQLQCYLWYLWLYILQNHFISHNCKVISHIYDFVSHNMTFDLTTTKLFVIFLALYLIITK